MADGVREKLPILCARRGLASNDRELTFGGTGWPFSKIHRPTPLRPLCVFALQIYDGISFVICSDFKTHQARRFFIQRAKPVKIISNAVAGSGIAWKLSP